MAKIKYIGDGTLRASDARKIYQRGTILSRISRDDDTASMATVQMKGRLYHVSRFPSGGKVIVRVTRE